MEAADVDGSSPGLRWAAFRRQRPKRMDGKWKVHHFENPEGTKRKEHTDWSLRREICSLRARVWLASAQDLERQRNPEF